MGARCALALRIISTEWNYLLHYGTAVAIKQRFSWLTRNKSFICRPPPARPASAVAAESGPHRPALRPARLSRGGRRQPVGAMAMRGGPFPELRAIPQPPYGGSLRVAVASNRQGA